MSVKKSSRRSRSDASYELVSHLASGGMAELFLARRHGDAPSAPLVVLKRILPAHVRNADFVSMFLDEARLASRLNHPNIARVIEVGRIDDTYCYTMEYVRGKNAREILIQAATSRTRIPLEIAVYLITCAATGLHAAHEARDLQGRPLEIVHRDVSPSNVMIGYDGTVKIVDFGVAKAADRMTETRSGTIKGKTAYLSPEQCRGRKIDRRSDVFSLGIVAWELLTQARLFRHDNDFDTMDAILRGRIPPPSELAEHVPRGVDAVLLRALARDPAERFSSAAEVTTALVSALGRPTPSDAPARMARFMLELFGAPVDTLPTVPVPILAELSLGSKSISVIPDLAGADDDLADDDLADDDLADDLDDLDEGSDGTGFEADTERGDPLATTRYRLLEPELTPMTPTPVVGAMAKLLGAKAGAGGTAPPGPGPMAGGAAMASGGAMAGPGMAGPGMAGPSARAATAPPVQRAGTAPPHPRAGTASPPRAGTAPPMPRAGTAPPVGAPPPSSSASVRVPFAPVSSAAVTLPGPTGGPPVAMSAAVTLPGPTAGSMAAVTLPGPIGLASPGPRPGSSPAVAPTGPRSGASPTASPMMSPASIAASAAAALTVPVPRMEAPLPSPFPIPRPPVLPPPVAASTPKTGLPVLRPTLPMGFMPKSAPPPAARPIASPAHAAVTLVATAPLPPSAPVAEGTLSSAGIWPLPFEPLPADARRRRWLAAFAGAGVAIAAMVVIAAVQSDPAPAAIEGAALAVDAAIGAATADAGVAAPGATAPLPPGPADGEGGARAVPTDDEVILPDEVAPIDMAAVVAPTVPAARPHTPPAAAKPNGAASVTTAAPTATPGPSARSAPSPTSTAAPTTTAPTATAPTTTAPTAPATTAAETPATPAAPTPLARTRQYLMRDQWGAAYGVCKDAHQADPNNVELTAACGLAACMLGKQSTAMVYARLLSSKRRMDLEKSCASRGKSITDCTDATKCRGS